MWQEDQGDGDVTSTTVCHTELLAFQHDLTSLRKLAQNTKAALPKVMLVNKSHKKRRETVALFFAMFHGSISII